MNKIKTALAAIGLVVFTSPVLAAEITFTTEIQKDYGRVLSRINDPVSYVKTNSPWIIEIVIKETDAFPSIPRDWPNLPYWIVPVEMYITQVDLGLNRALVANWDEAKIERGSIRVFGTLAYEYFHLWGAYSNPQFDTSKSLIANSNALGGYTDFTANADPFLLPNNESKYVHWSSAGKFIASTMTIHAVPEPSTYAMLGLGLGVMGFAARRRKSA